MTHALIFCGPVMMDGKGATRLQRIGGAHKIATWLRFQGWDVEVVDYFFNWSLEELQQFCKSRISDKTTFIGYSAVFATNDERLTNFITWFKITYPNIKIIAGGQDVVLTKIDADYYIDGYSEYALDAVIKHIIKKDDIKSIKLNNGNLIKSNIDYPAYPMEDLPIRYEKRDYIDPHETLPIEISRGCKFRCMYCNYPILGVKGDYSRSGNGFKEEINYVYDNFGVTKFNVADETINDRSEKLEKFANASQQLSFVPWLNGFIRFDLMVSRKQDWDLLIGMNLFGHHYGIDTFNWESGKAVGKGMHPDKMKSGLIEVKEYFKKTGPYKGTITMIAGLPHETNESLDTTLDWIEKNWQGEAFRLFPLWIPKLGSGVTGSTLAGNYQKSGYVEMNDDEINEYSNTYDLKELGFKNSRMQENIVFWKNKDMNFIQAENRVYKFQNRTRGKFSHMGWTMGEAAQLTHQPIKELILLSDDDEMGGKQKIKNIIKKYIDKKLGYQ